MNKKKSVFSITCTIVYLTCCRTFMILIQSKLIICELKSWVSLMVDRAKMKILITGVWIKRYKVLYYICQNIKLWTEIILLYLAFLSPFIVYNKGR